MTEQLETKVRPSEWRKGKTEKHKVPTGRLRITVTQGWREVAVLEDKGNVRLETLLDRFFIALYKAVIKQWRDARQSKLLEEQERLDELRRAEVERIRAEKGRIAAAERRRREALCAEARRWKEAENIRSYVTCVRANATDPAGSPDAQAPRPTDDWAKWALAVADELDPTRARLQEETSNEYPDPLMTSDT